jgi:hypothetical protein
VAVDEKNSMCSLGRQAFQKRGNCVGIAECRDKRTFIPLFLAATSPLSRNCRGQETAFEEILPIIQGIWKRSVICEKAINLGKTAALSVENQQAVT